MLFMTINNIRTHHMLYLILL
ncbi:hypothetical protein [Macellibacteroides fermentans]